MPSVSNPDPCDSPGAGLRLAYIDLCFERMRMAEDGYPFLLVLRHRTGAIAYPLPDTTEAIRAAVLRDCEKLKVAELKRNVKPVLAEVE